MPPIIWNISIPYLTEFWSLFNFLVFITMLSHEDFLKIYTIKFIHVFPYNSLVKDVTFLHLSLRASLVTEGHQLWEMCQVPSSRGGGGAPWGGKQVFHTLPSEVREPVWDC